MDMIQNHFEQIALSASAIAELPFPKAKIFTNALLHSHDITALIRDTEVHEKALFTAAIAESSSSRKSVAPNAASREGTLSSLKPGTAVGRILGSDLQRRIRRSERNKGDVDVDLLLEGAEKLCAAYPMAGVLDRVQSMKSRHDKLAESIALYEEKLEEQAYEFESLGAATRGGVDDEPYVAPSAPASLHTTAAPVEQINPLNFDDEEAEVEQLEQKKRGLEARVTGLERDLGGLRG